MPIRTLENYIDGDGEIRVDQRLKPGGRYSNLEEIARLFGTKPEVLLTQNIPVIEPGTEKSTQPNRRLLYPKICPVIKNGTNGN